MKNKALSIIVVLILAAVLALPVTHTATAATANMTVVSDTTVLVTQGNLLVSYPYSAVAAWEPGLADPNPPDPNNSYWDTNLNYVFNGSADWIWESYLVVHPVAGDIVHFQKAFNVPGFPTGGTLYITCDNGYEVYLNGHLVGTAQLGADWETSNLTQPFVDHNGWQSVEMWSVSSLLVAGNNVLTIKAANEYQGPLDGQQTGPAYSNPGGLIFQLDVSYDALGYTHTWGYWKTHSSHGPAPYDDTWAGLEGVTFFISGTTYYGVLEINPAGGNAYYQLAHQYVAAKLSQLDGAWMRGDVQDAFDEATGLLNTNTPAQIASFKKGDAEQKAIFSRFNQLASILDAYNNGNMGTPHAP